MNDDILRMRQNLHNQQMGLKHQQHQQRVQKLHDKGAQQVLEMYRMYGPDAVRASVQNHLQHGGNEAAQYLHGVAGSLQRQGHSAILSDIMGGPSPQQAQPDVAVPQNQRGGRAKGRRR